MKPATLLLCAAIVNTTLLSAQTIELSYRDNTPSKNVGLDYVHPIKQWNLSAGIKYHINPDPNTTSSHVFYHNMYASKTYEKFGVQLGVSRKVWTFENPWNAVSWYAAVQANHLGFLAYSYEIQSQDSFEYAVAKRTKVPPFVSLEGSTGLRLDAAITKHVGMFMSAGLGGLFSFMKSQTRYVVDTDAIIRSGKVVGRFEQYAYQLGVGLTYHIKS